MRYVVAACVAAFGLLFLISPAHAVDCPAGTTLDAGGLFCISAPVTMTVTSTVTSTATRTVAGPTQTVTVPGPTRTVTASASPRTVTATVTASPTTVTETTTQTITPAGQSNARPATVDKTPATLTTPPAEPGSKVDVVPDTPGAALAQGTLLGIIMGVLAVLFIVYLRGKKAGEKETLQDSLKIIRGDDDTQEIPRVGRHRAS